MNKDNSKSPTPDVSGKDTETSKDSKRIERRSSSGSPPSRTNRVSRSPSTEHERDEVLRDRSERHQSKSRSMSRSKSPSPPKERNDRRKRRDRSLSRDRDRARRSRSTDRARSHKYRSPDRRRRSLDRSFRRSRSRSPKAKKARDESPGKENTLAESNQSKKEPVDLLRTRAGGAYIPPAKLRLMQAQISDKSSEQYQRMNWERMKKKIHGLVNKVNTGNLVHVVREILQENVIRGKGLLARSIIQAQSFSPVFSNVYAALVAVINSKFPNIGELILRRLVVQFKRSFRRNDKGTTVSVSKFIAHLINQQVAHELLALEIMMLMLESPTEDSVEVAIAFMKECGAKLTEVTPRALDAVFTRLRDIIQEKGTASRIQYMIEAALMVRKDKFKAFPIMLEELDLIDEDDQTTHTMSLEDAIDPETALNVFKLDPEFEKNEQWYDDIRKEIIGDNEGSDDEEEEDDDEDGDAEDNAEEKKDTETVEIIDNTEQNLVAFRREIYLTIQSSLDYQEAAHKLLKMNIKANMETELCHMLVDCCVQQRTYERFYGLLVERFCRLKIEFQNTFEQIARDTYATVHRFDITKLRNISRLIAHLLFTDAISWNILSDIRLNEEETTSSGRIYIKYIFQELVESMGLLKLYDRVKDPTMQAAFAGIFPRDKPENTRFAINFFTLIGLGGLTLDLREFLEKGMKKRKEMLEIGDEDDSSSSSSSSSDSSDSDSSDSDSSSSSSDSDTSVEVKKKKKKPSKEVKKEVKQEPDPSPERVDPPRHKHRDRSRSRDRHSKHSRSDSSKIRRDESRNEVRRPRGNTEESRRDRNPDRERRRRSRS